MASPGNTEEKIRGLDVSQDVISGRQTQLKFYSKVKEELQTNCDTDTLRLLENKYEEMVPDFLIETISEQNFDVATKLVKTLDKAGCPINLKDYLEEIIEHDCGIEVFKWLKQQDPEIDFKGSVETPLQLAASSRKPNAVKALISLGAIRNNEILFSVMTTDQLPISASVEKEILVTLRAFCETESQLVNRDDIPIDYKYRHRGTALDPNSLELRNILYFAVEQNLPLVVNYLLTKEDVPGLLNTYLPDKQTPFTFALHTGRWDMAIVILQNAGHLINLEVLQHGLCLAAAAPDPKNISVAIVAKIKKTVDLLLTEIAKRTTNLDCADFGNPRPTSQNTRFAVTFKQALSELLAPQKQREQKLPFSLLFFKRPRFAEYIEQVKNQRHLLGNDQKTEITPDEKVNPALLEFEKILQADSVNEVTSKTNFIGRTTNTYRNISVSKEKAEKITQFLLENPDAIGFLYQKGLLSRAVALVICFEAQSFRLSNAQKVNLKPYILYFAQLWEVIKRQGLAYPVLLQPCDELGNTLLHIAARAKNKAIGKLVLEELLKVAPITTLHLKNKNGETPSDVASEELKLQFIFIEQKNNSSLFDLFHFYTEFAKKPLTAIHRFKSQANKRIAQRFFATKSLIIGLLCSKETQQQKHVFTGPILDQIAIFIEVTGGTNNPFKHHHFASLLKGLLLSPRTNDELTPEVFFESEELIVERLKQQAKELLHYLAYQNPKVYDHLVKSWGLPTVEKRVFEAVKFVNYPEPKKQNADLERKSDAAKTSEFPSVRPK